MNDIAQKTPNGASIWLYHTPGTRAVRARWMLEELGLNHVLAHMDLRQGAHKQADYLAIHPLGKVPALKIDGTVIFESLAICLYLAEREDPSRLAPALGECVARAEYLKWMAFSTGTLEPAVFEQMRIQKAGERRLEPIDLGPALTPLDNVVSYVEAILATHPFLMGEAFGAADIMNGSVFMWADDMGLLPDRQNSGPENNNCENIRAWLLRLKARPAFKRAIVEQTKGAL